MSLNQKQRGKIFATVRKRVLKNHFNGAGIDYSEWTQAFDQRSAELLTVDVETFECGVQDLLKRLGSSHTGFYHERPNRLFPQHTINATLGDESNESGRRWFFMDVFEAGPADSAGIRPGDVLTAVDGKSYAPPDRPPFKTGATHTISISAPDGTAARELSVHVPQRKGNKNLPPILPPKSISSSMVGPGTGLLRITWFPGSMGLAFAKDLDSAIADLKQRGCNRLVVDLRGNIGGGLGFARLASYLCPDRRPIGYSLTPARQRRGYKLEGLERVAYPASAIGFAAALTRFAGRDKSICLMTQGLGPQPFHGNVAVLVNEWTNSAAEMVAGFASENKLAAIIGRKTAGNVLGAVNVKVGGGYWLRLPVFGWLTSGGACLEGTGVVPNLAVEVHPEELHVGIDRQLLAAQKVFEGATTEAKNHPTATV